MAIGRDQLKSSSCPNATFSAINLTWTALCLNPVLCCEKQATSRPNYDTDLYKPKLVPAEISKCVHGCQEMCYLCA
jgi:hypothetical protein